MKNEQIALVDNYDSFTFNLVHVLEKYGAKVKVYKNDQVSLAELDHFSKIVLSPGPSLPKDAGQMMNVIDQYYKTKSILGVCLGMQGIVEYFGGKLFNQEKVKHGIAEEIILDQKEPLFRGLNQMNQVGLYHSWATKRNLLPTSLVEKAKSNSGLTMAIRHVKFDILGVQFHPESVLTENGEKMLKNWLTSHHD